MLRPASRSTSIEMPRQSSISRRAGQTASRTKATPWSTVDGSATIVVPRCAHGAPLPGRSPVSPPRRLTFLLYREAGKVGSREPQPDSGAAAHGGHHVAVPLVGPFRAYAAGVA